MSITTINEQLVHYEVIGRDEPMVFVHGWLGSWRYWWPSMQDLSSQNRTFAFDLWGYGDSSKSPENYSFESYVQLLKDFIEKLGIAAPVTLVGHSLGATVALRYARERLERVKRLAMVSLPLSGGHIHNQMTDAEPAEIIRRYSRNGSYAEVKSEIHKTDRIAVSALASQLAEIDFISELQDISCPVLLIYGDRDPIVRPPNGDGRHLACPESKHYLVTLENCRHFPMLEQPARFNRLLKDFVLDDNNEHIAPKTHWQRRTR
jgi:pimeloyl-ACP methyl ester carboxylesterase